MWARFMASKRSDRLRTIGRCVLAAGLIGAAVFYWWSIRSVDSTMDDLTALGYTRSMQHEIGAQMGQSGLILMDLQQMLTSPAGEAAMIVVVAVVLAVSFRRAAWVLDENERLHSGSSPSESA